MKKTYIKILLVAFLGCLLGFVCSNLYFYNYKKNRTKYSEYIANYEIELFDYNLKIDSCRYQIKCLNRICKLLQKSDIVEYKCLLNLSNKNEYDLILEKIRLIHSNSDNGIFYLVNMENTNYNHVEIIVLYDSKEEQNAKNLINFIEDNYYRNILEKTYDNIYTILDINKYVNITDRNLKKLEYEKPINMFEIDETRKIVVEQTINTAVLFVAIYLFIHTIFNKQ